MAFTKQLVVRDMSRDQLKEIVPKIIIGVIVWTGTLLALSGWVIRSVPCRYVTQAELDKELRQITQMVNRVECRVINNKLAFVK